MYQWILIFGSFVSFYNAWGIGANDCANSFATSVGAKVLTLKQAIIVAGVFEFLGAFLMGSHVTSAIRKKIVSIDIFEDDPGALMFGMLCSNMAAAIWLNIATYFKYPVSTTHSIIGAIIGFSLSYGGANAVNWESVGWIVFSWVLSPAISGLLAWGIYVTIKKYVFNSSNPVDNTLLIFPILTFFTFLINGFFIFYKGTPELKLDELPVWVSVLTAICMGLFFSALSWFFYVPYAKKKLEENRATRGDTNSRKELTPLELLKISLSPETEESSTDSDETVVLDNDNFKNKILNSEFEDKKVKESFLYSSDLSIDKNVSRLSKFSEFIKTKEKAKQIEILHKNAVVIDPDAEQLCSSLQVITACFSAFAHGANDVANAIAPLATIYAIYLTGEVNKKSNVPLWVLFIGGLGIVTGLATWGYRIIERIGEELTKITPSRGFIIELSAATTTVIASRAELPVSTTHCQIGSVIGCGLGDKVNNIEWSLVKGIILSWLVTLPATGFISAGLFSFGYHSP